jgi:hypothetical protein
LPEARAALRLPRRLYIMVDCGLNCQNAAIYNGRGDFFAEKENMVV